MEVVVNAAVSVDGKLSTADREQVQISGPSDKKRVERLRASADAVMVGIGTILADDPELTVKNDKHQQERLDRGDAHQPISVVVDSTARTPVGSNVINTEASSLILVTRDTPSDRIAALEGKSAKVIKAGNQRVDLQEGISLLEDQGISRLIVEGGGELLFSMFEERLADRVFLYIGGILIGGSDAPTLADGDGFSSMAEFPSLRLEKSEPLDEGVLTVWEVMK